MTMWCLKVELRGLVLNPTTKVETYTVLWVFLILHFGKNISNKLVIFIDCDITQLLLGYSIEITYPLGVTVGFEVLA